MDRKEINDYLTDNGSDCYSAIHYFRKNLRGY